VNIKSLRIEDGIWSLNLSGCWATIRWNHLLTTPLLPKEKSRHHDFRLTELEKHPSATNGQPSTKCKYRPQTSYSPLSHRAAWMTHQNPKSQKSWTSVYETLIFQNLKPIFILTHQKYTKNWTSSITHWISSENPKSIEVNRFRIWQLIIPKITLEFYPEFPS